VHVEVYKLRGLFRNFCCISHSPTSIANSWCTIIHMKKWLIGVDEAGRGPLAGPVSVGVVAVPIGFDFDRIPGVGDSKKVTQKKREEVFERAMNLQETGEIRSSVVLVSETQIDKEGITSVILSAIEKGLTECDVDPQESVIKLDGLLKAPIVFVDQETIIKGDDKEQVIGLASILAKVTRDRYMVATSEKYPLYGFEVHKGYGTKKHCAAIFEHGLSPIHRKTYCSRFTSQ